MWHRRDSHRPHRPTVGWSALRVLDHVGRWLQASQGNAPGPNMQGGSHGCSATRAAWSRPTTVARAEHTRACNGGRRASGPKARRVLSFSSGCAPSCRPQGRFAAGPPRPSGRGLRTGASAPSLVPDRRCPTLRADLPRGQSTILFRIPGPHRSTSPGMLPLVAMPHQRDFPR